MKIVYWVLITLGGIFAAYVLLLVISALAVDRKKQYDNYNKYYRFLLYSATAIGMWLLRIKFVVTGEEKLPQRRFLLICNHRSNYDPLVTWHCFRKYQLTFISKPENFKVPIFGRLVHRCGFLPIDRVNPRNAAKTLITAVNRIKSDTCSIMVYPEGTRSKGTKLLDFHAGVLKIAQKAKVPLVIMTVAGTEQIYKRTPWRKTVVYQDILEVIPYEELAGKHTTDIGAYAHERMEQHLRKRDQSER